MYSWTSPFQTHLVFCLDFVALANDADANDGGKRRILTPEEEISVEYFSASTGNGVYGEEE